MERLERRACEAIVDWLVKDYSPDWPAGLYMEAARRGLEAADDCVSAWHFDRLEESYRALAEGDE